MTFLPVLQDAPDTFGGKLYVGSPLLGCDSDALSRHFDAASTAGDPALISRTSAANARATRTAGVSRRAGVGTENNLSVGGAPTIVSDPSDHNPRVRAGLRSLTGGAR